MRLFHRGSRARIILSFPLIIQISGVAALFPKPARADEEMERVEAFEAAIDQAPPKTLKKAKPPTASSGKVEVVRLTETSIRLGSELRRLDRVFNNKNSVTSGPFDVIQFSGDLLKVQSDLLSWKSTLEENFRQHAFIPSSKGFKTDNRLFLMMDYFSRLMKIAQLRAAHARIQGSWVAPLRAQEAEDQFELKIPVRTFYSLNGYNEFEGFLSASSLKALLQKNQSFVILSKKSYGSLLADPNSRSEISLQLSSKLLEEIEARARDRDASEASWFSAARYGLSAFLIESLGVLNVTTRDPVQAPPKFNAKLFKDIPALADQSARFWENDKDRVEVRLRLSLQEAAKRYAFTLPLAKDSKLGGADSKTGVFSLSDEQAEALNQQIRRRQSLSFEYVTPELAESVVRVLLPQAAELNAKEVAVLIDDWVITEHMLFQGKLLEQLETWAAPFSAYTETELRAVFADMISLALSQASEPILNTLLPVAEKKDAPKIKTEKARQHREIRRLLSERRQELKKQLVTAPEIADLIQTAKSIEEKVYEEKIRAPYVQDLVSRSKAIFRATQEPAYLHEVDLPILIQSLGLLSGSSVSEGLTRPWWDLIRNAPSYRQAQQLYLSMIGKIVLNNPIGFQPVVLAELAEKDCEVNSSAFERYIGWPVIPGTQNRNKAEEELDVRKKVILRDSLRLFLKQGCWLGFLQQGHKKSGATVKLADLPLNPAQIAVYRAMLQSSLIDSNILNFNQWSLTDGDPFTVSGAFKDFAYSIGERIGADKRFEFAKRPSEQEQKRLYEILANLDIQAGEDRPTDAENLVQADYWITRAESGIKNFAFQSAEKLALLGDGDYEKLEQLTEKIDRMLTLVEHSSQFQKRFQSQFPALSEVQRRAILDRAPDKFYGPLWSREAKEIGKYIGYYAGGVIVGKVLARIVGLKFFLESERPLIQRFLQPGAVFFTNRFGPILGPHLDDVIAPWNLLALFALGTGVYYGDTLIRGSSVNYQNINSFYFSSSEASFFNLAEYEASKKDLREKVNEQALAVGGLALILGLGIFAQGISLAVKEYKFNSFFKDMRLAGVTKDEIEAAISLEGGVANQGYWIALRTTVLKRLAIIARKLNDEWGIDADLPAIQNITVLDDEIIGLADEVERAAANIAKFRRAAARVLSEIDAEEKSFQLMLKELHPELVALYGEQATFDLSSKSLLEAISIKYRRTLIDSSAEAMQDYLRGRRAFTNLSLRLSEKANEANGLGLMRLYYRLKGDSEAMAEVVSSWKNFEASASSGGFSWRESFRLARGNVKTLDPIFVRRAFNEAYYGQNGVIRFGKNWDPANPEQGKVPSKLLEAKIINLGGQNAGQRLDLMKQAEVDSNEFEAARRVFAEREWDWDFYEVLRWVESRGSSPLNPQSSAFGPTQALPKNVGRLVDRFFLSNEQWPKVNQEEFRRFSIALKDFLNHPELREIYNSFYLQKDAGSFGFLEMKGITHLLGGVP